MGKPARPEKDAPKRPGGKALAFPTRRPQAPSPPAPHAPRMADDDPVTKPRDTSLRSEGIPESTHPLAEKHFDSGLKDENRDPEHPDRPRTAVRQDGSLGDTSPRDETKQ